MGLASSVLQISLDNKIYICNHKSYEFGLLLKMSTSFPSVVCFSCLQHLNT